MCQKSSFIYSQIPMSGSGYGTRNPSCGNLATKWSGAYRNDPKFSDRYAWANSADPDQTAPLRVYTVCLSVCIVWAHYSMVEPRSSNYSIVVF